MCYKSHLKNKGHNNITSTIQACDSLQFLSEALFLQNIDKLQKLQVMNRQLSLTIIITNLFFTMLLLDT